MPILKNIRYNANAMTAIMPFVLKARKLNDWANNAIAIPFDMKEGC